MIQHSLYNHCKNDDIKSNKKIYTRVQYLPQYLNLHIQECISRSKMDGNFSKLCGKFSKHSKFEFQTGLVSKPLSKSNCDCEKL